MSVHVIKYMESCFNKDCQDCPLWKTRTQVVFEQNPEGAEVCFIGESPKQEDDLQGSPFVGPEGQFFRRSLKNVGIDPDTVAMLNSVACRPPDNRKPTSKEKNACFKYVDGTIKASNYKLIVTLGDVALHLFYPSSQGITKSHGQFPVDNEQYGCKIFHTFQPSHIMRKDGEIYRSAFMKDLETVAKFLNGTLKVEPVKETHYVTIEALNQFEWLIKKLHENKEWACDTETTSKDFRDGEIFIFTFSWSEATAVLLDLRSEFCKSSWVYVWKKLKEIFENDSKKIFHNGPFDLKMLMNYGIEVNNYYADTLHMHYLLDENKTHGLEILATELTDRGGYESKLMNFINQWKIEQKKAPKIEDSEMSEVDEDVPPVDTEEQEFILEGVASPDVLRTLKTKPQMSYMDIPNEILYPYAQTDADVTFRCYRAMLPEIEKQGLEFVLFDIMMPAQKILIKTEYSGVPIDVSYLHKLIEKYERDIQHQLQLALSDPVVRSFVHDKQKEMIDELREKYEDSKALRNRYTTFEDYLECDSVKKKQFKFNPNSSKQLKELLFERMKLPILKYTDNKKRKNKSAEKNPSTDAEVLEQYAKLNGFCAHISKQRTLLHLKATFLDGFLKKVGEDGRIHTNYLMFGTVAGRPSSKDPNLNNIPRTSTASDIKDLYHATEGKWLMELDGKAMEFRVWASMSGDQRMIRDIELGLDIHKAMAGVSYFGRSLPDKGDITQEQFDALVEGVTKEQRQTAKTEVVFGPMYGRGIEAIAKALGCSKQEAGRILNELFKRYRVGAAYLNSLKAMCRRDGYVQSLFGRRRRLPNIVSTDMGLRSDAERQCINSPIQGSASDIVLLAGSRIDKMLRENSMKTELLLTVYDSLAYHIPEDELQFMVDYAPVEFIRHLKELNVNLDVEMKVGKRWGSLVEVDWKKPWREEFERVKIQVEESEAKLKTTFGLEE